MGRGNRKQPPNENDATSPHQFEKRFSVRPIRAEYASDSQLHNGGKDTRESKLLGYLTSIYCL